MDAQLTSSLPFRRDSFASRCCSRAMSGTPVSTLDPAGYPTVEKIYAKIASNLQVRVLMACGDRASCACVAALGAGQHTHACGAV